MPLIHRKRKLKGFDTPIDIAAIILVFILIALIVWYAAHRFGLT